MDQGGFSRRRVMIAASSAALAAPWVIGARRALAQARPEKTKVLLGVESKEALSPLMDGFAAHRERVPRWQFDTFNPARLLGFDELATKP